MKAEASSDVIFVKKSQKTPKPDLDLAMGRAKEIKP